MLRQTRANTLHARLYSMTRDEGTRMDTRPYDNIYVRFLSLPIVPYLSL